MKKIFSLAFMTGVIFLFGCSQNWTAVIDTTTTTSPTTTEQTDNERKTYTNTSHWFSLQYPSDWTFQEEVYDSLVMFFSPLTDTKDNLKENLGISTKAMTKNYTLDEIWQVTKESFGQVFSDFVEISNENLQVGGLDAKKIIYKWKQWNTMLQFEVVYILQEQTLYTITYTATEKTFEDFVQTINAILATREIK